MLSQVKKLADPSGRKDFAGRFGAWWNGEEYVPAPQEDGEGETAAETAVEGDSPAEPSTSEDAAEEKPASANRLEIPGIPIADADTDGARIAALERMWGVGRFGPGATDHKVLDLLEGGLTVEGGIGVMGADPALIRSVSKRIERDLIASEWRTAAIDRIRRAVPNAPVVADDVDRTKAFPEESLAALASVNTMAFADHKAGLVSCAHHALKDGGRWVIVDFVRTTPKTPQHAFASAWGEPQLSEEAEIDALLEKAGFGDIRKENLTTQVIDTARAHMTELGAALEQTVSEGMAGSQGVLFLRELVWELKSWRARLKALERGALRVVMWSSVKGGTPGAAPDNGDTPEAALAEAADEQAAPTSERSEAGGDEIDPLADLDDALFDELT